MNKFDEPAQPRRCGARNRQDKRPCANWATPFGAKCSKHGGNTTAAREKARKAALDYEKYGSDPAWRKAKRLAHYRIATRRWELRRAKQRGPAAVAHLQAEWAAEAAEKRAWLEDTRRATAEQKQREKQEWLRSLGRSPSGPQLNPDFDYDTQLHGFVTGFQDWEL